MSISLLQSPTRVVKVSPPEVQLALHSSNHHIMTSDGTGSGVGGAASSSIPPPLTYATLSSYSKADLIEKVLQLQSLLTAQCPSPQRASSPRINCERRKREYAKIKEESKERGSMVALAPPRSSSLPPSPYVISLSVMVIHKRSVVVLPLPSLIHRNDLGGLLEEEREPDTPVVAARYLGDTFAPEGPSFRDFSRLSYSEDRNEEDEKKGIVAHAVPPLKPLQTLKSGQDDPRGNMIEGALASQPLFFGKKLFVDNEPQPVALTTRVYQREEGEPSPKRPVHYRDCYTKASLLTSGANAAVAQFRSASQPCPLLDDDALVSSRTYAHFRPRFHGGIRGGPVLTPVSPFGMEVYQYIVKTFCLRNNCRHHPDDIEGFGRTLLMLCQDVQNILKAEPRHGSMASPCYVFGDLHGNFRDLFYFMDGLISFQDLRYTPHRFMFLGDYVDRGEFSVEVVAYLFAMKVLAPEKILLLRGNHEDTLVCGDVGGYGSTSFRAQCHTLFGVSLGEEVWLRVTQVFMYLPLSANIDHSIFCAHGGIPRYDGSGPDDRLEQLQREDVPPMASFFEVPEQETSDHERLRRLAMDTCWADPAEDESLLDRHGFGDNPRGSGVILFGSTAVEAFLVKNKFHYIFRAHQEKADGLKLCKHSRVFTIFSTSSYVGHTNGAGMVLVADGKIRLIVKNADVEEDDEMSSGFEDGRDSEEY